MYIVVFIIYYTNVFIKICEHKKKCIKTVKIRWSIEKYVYMYTLTYITLRYGTINNNI